MQFKINNTEFKISFTFFALVLLAISVTELRMYRLTLVFGLMHELVHLFFICKLSLPPKKITLTLFGANIKRNGNSSLKNSDEFIINISAPLFNIIIGVILELLIDDKTEIQQTIIAINILLGGFNLLPFYNFDGGNALRSLLLINLNENVTEKILTITSVCVTICFSLLTSIVFFKYKNNPSLIIINFYFLLSLFFKKR